MAGYDMTPEITIWDLMDVGYSFASIGHLRKGRKLGPTSSNCPGLVQLVKDFCDSIEALELPKSSELVSRLRTRHLARLEEALESDQHAFLYARTARKLRVDLNGLWNVVRDEATRRRVYPIIPFYFPAFERFVDNPRQTLELMAAYEPELPKELDENLNEAKQCLSVGFVAAATVFILRAMEVVLKYYYELVTGESAGRHTWGNLRDLLGQTECEAPSELVRMVTHLKDGYRDPTMHVLTEKRLELDEFTAHEVLNLCGAVIANMMGHLEVTGRTRPCTGLLADQSSFEE